MHYYKITIIEDLLTCKPLLEVKLLYKTKLSVYFAVLNVFVELILKIYKISLTTIQNTFQFETNQSISQI